MSLIIHQGNRLEALAEALAAQLHINPPPPMEEETILVQSAAIRSWLQFELAKHLGVLMNVHFEFPASFVAKLFQCVLPCSIPSPIFLREVLPWRIHSILPAFLEQPSFSELRHYVEGEHASLKLAQLSHQIATVFDSYLAHRPELIAAWENGATGDWQPHLWRALSADAPNHLPGLAEKLRRQLETGKPAQLPRRFFAFALSTLAPFHLQVLGAIAAHTEVQIFLLTPTRHYWGDIRSEKEIGRMQKWATRKGKRFDYQPPETGNHLLASLGRLGREFHELLLDLEPGDTPDHFVDPGHSTLLASLQSDMLELEDTPHTLAPTDSSIRIHNCHSPLRELEVLHDSLLARFDSDPTLRPRDVLVTMPDVEPYAALIDSVFGAPENERQRLPYSIADRAARSENKVTAVLLRILEMTESRFESSEVMALLECPPVQARYQILESELPLLREWVIESGVRWGRDEAHRISLGLPHSSSNT